MCAIALCEDSQHRYLGGDASLGLEESGHLVQSNVDPIHDHVANLCRILAMKSGS